VTDSGSQEVAYVEFILEAIARIERYTAAGRAVFFEDTMIQDAVLRIFKHFPRRHRVFQRSHGAGIPKYPGA
jgi:hypothetical protein